MTPFEWECERTFLEHLMFTLYHYGDSSENPLLDSVRMHFDTLASKHPDVTLRVPMYVGGCDSFSFHIRLTDFEGQSLCPKRLEKAVWSARQCYALRDAILQQRVVV